MTDIIGVAVLFWALLLAIFMIPRLFLRYRRSLLYAFVGSIITFLAFGWYGWWYISDELEVAPGAFPVAALDSSKYLPELDYCTQSFVEKLESSAVEASVTYSGQDQTSFSFVFRGRGPSLALEDEGFVEHMEGYMRVFQSISPNEGIKVDIIVTRALQARWPKTKDSWPTAARFEEFGDGQRNGIGDFERRYGTFLSQCVGRDRR